MPCRFPALSRPLHRLAHPREMIRHFTPNWFAVTMGTGILAIALTRIVPDSPLLYALARTLWLADIVLFVSFTLLYAARWMFFFDEARRIFDHGVMSMFLGCIPMGLATVVNGILIFVAPWSKEAAAGLALGLWWLDVVLALACGVAIPFLMFTRQDHAIERMTAVWLLPVVAAEVAAVSGGMLVPALGVADARLTVLVVSYGLWACSVPPAMSILVILLLRMALHKLPPADMAATSWLALGPIGTGALGLLVLGDAAPAVLAAHGMEAMAGAVRGIGLIGGLVLWGHGLWWAALAGLITLRYLRHGIPFNLGWWGYIFPLGVFAVATLRLAETVLLDWIGGFGVGLVVVLAGLWLVVAARTVRGAWRGDLFAAPCLAPAP